MLPWVLVASALKPDCLSPSRKNYGREAHCSTREEEWVPCELEVIHDETKDLKGKTTNTKEGITVQWMLSPLDFQAWSS